MFDVNHKAFSKYPNKKAFKQISASFSVPDTAKSSQQTEWIARKREEGKSMAEKLFYLTSFAVKTQTSNKFACKSN